MQKPLNCSVLDFWMVNHSVPIEGNNHNQCFSFKRCQRIISISVSIPLSVTTFGTRTYLQPMDTRQYLYCLKPKKEFAEKAGIIKGVTVIGKLDIVWKTNLGERGRLQTSQLQRMVSLEKTNGGFGVGVVDSQNNLNFPSSITKNQTTIDGINITTGKRLIISLISRQKIGIEINEECLNVNLSVIHCFYFTRQKLK